MNINSDSFEKIMAHVTRMEELDKQYASIAWGEKLNFEKVIKYKPDKTPGEEIWGIIVRHHLQGLGGLDLQGQLIWMCYALHHNDEDTVKRYLTSIHEKEVFKDITEVYHSVFRELFRFCFLESPDSSIQLNNIAITLILSYQWTEFVTLLKAYFLNSGFYDDYFPSFYRLDSEIASEVLLSTIIEKYNSNCKYDYDINLARTSLKYLALIPVATAWKWLKEFVNSPHTIESYDQKHFFETLLETMVSIRNDDECCMIFMDLYTKLPEKLTGLLTKAILRLDTPRVKNVAISVLQSDEYFLKTDALQYFTRLIDPTTRDLIRPFLRSNWQNVREQAYYALRNLPNYELNDFPEDRPFAYIASKGDVYCKFLPEHAFFLLRFLRDNDAEVRSIVRNKLKLIEHNGIKKIFSIVRQAERLEKIRQQRDYRVVTEQGCFVYGLKKSSFTNFEGIRCYGYMEIPYKNNYGGESICFVEQIDWLNKKLGDGFQKLTMYYSWLTIPDSPHFKRVEEILESEGLLLQEKYEYCR